MKSVRAIFPDVQPTSLRVGTADIPFTTCAPKLRFVISDNITLDKYISTVFGSAYMKIRRISSIRQFLTVKTTKTFVCVFVLSKL